MHGEIYKLALYNIYGGYDAKHAAKCFVLQLRWYVAKLVAKWEGSEHLSVQVHIHMMCDAFNISCT